MNWLADILSRAYAERDLDSRIEATDTEIVLTGDGYRLRFATGEQLTVEGVISRESFYALGIADEQTEGAISRAFDRGGYDLDAEQTRYSLDAIKSGRGPIYRKEETT